MSSEAYNQKLQEDINRLAEEIQARREQVKRLFNENAAKGEEVFKLQIKRSEFEKKLGDKVGQKKKHDASVNDTTIIAPEDSNEYLWRKRIEQKVQEIVDEKIAILSHGGGISNQTNLIDGGREETATYRPFVNSINVKLKSKDLSQQMMMIAAKEGAGGKKKKAEFVEQKFRVTKETTFIDLKLAACDFWALEPSKFNLYDENMLDLMSLNQDPTHPAHTVENYFKLVMVKNLPTLHLARPNLENTSLQPAQKSAIIIRGGSKEAKQRPIEEQVNPNSQNNPTQVKDPKKERRRANVKEFLGRYPGMLQYYIGDSSKRALSTEHLKNPDTKFCTSFAMAMILMLTCLSLFLRRDLNEQYYTQLFVEDQFYTVFSETLKRPGENEDYYMDFDYLTNVAEYKKYINYTVARVLFPDEITGAQPIIFKNAIPIGLMRFRQQRSSQKPCTLQLAYDNGTTLSKQDQLKCYHEFVHLGMETGVIGDGSQQWHHYRSSQEAKEGDDRLGSSLGESEVFDGSGYIIDIPIANLTQQSFQKFFTGLFSGNESYISPSTRVVFISFSFYQPVSDYFIAINIMAEFLISGYLYPSGVRIYPFKANVFELSGEKALQACDIFRLIFCFYLVYIIYQKIRYHRPVVPDDYGAFLIQLVIDFGIVFFFFFAWVLSYYYSSQHTQEILQKTNEERYYDLIDKGQWYQEAFSLDSVSLVLCLIKVMWLFKLSRYVHWIFLTIERAIATIVTYMVVIIPCFAGFTCIVYLVFGPYVYAYHTFSYSLKSVIFFILGQLDTESMVLTNAVVAVAWSYIFYFFVIFVFLSLFMAVFIISFEVAVKTDGMGYPEDFQDRARWEYSDYTYWIIEQWFPERILKKIRAKNQSKCEQSSQQVQQNNEQQSNNATLEDIVGETQMGLIQAGSDENLGKAKSIIQ